MTKQNPPTIPPDNPTQLSPSTKQPPSYLPDDIYYIILANLPAKSLLRFRSVSKSWKSIISDPRFIRSHFNLSKTLTHPTKIFCRFVIGSTTRTLYCENNRPSHFKDSFFPVSGAHVLSSCHGLVLLAHSKKRSFYLWNPSLRKFRSVLCPRHLCSFLLAENTCGLCYDSSIDDYKIVLIGRNYHITYSLTIDSWGWKKEFPYVIVDSKAPVVVDGALHCAAIRDEGGIDEIHIIRFNPKDESFKIIPKPKSLHKNSKFSLMDMEGSLGLSHCSSDWRKKIGTVTIWSKTGQDCDNPSLWVKIMEISDMRYSVIRFFVPRVLYYTGEGEIMFYGDLGHRSTTWFYIYDVKERKLFEMEEVGTYTPVECAVTCIDSLLLPGGLGDRSSKWRDIVPRGGIRKEIHWEWI